MFYHFFFWITLNLFVGDPVLLDTDDIIAGEIMTSLFAEMEEDGVFLLVGTGVVIVEVKVIEPEFVVF